MCVLSRPAVPARAANSWYTAAALIGGSAALILVAAYASGVQPADLRNGLPDNKLARRRRKKQASANDLDESAGKSSGSDKEAVPDDAGDAGELEDLAAAVIGTNERMGQPWGAGQVQRSTRGAMVQDAGSVQDDTTQESGSLPGRQRIYVKTQGCAHNSSDSEFMMGLLRDYGYTFAETAADADAVLINSCTVKNPSQDAATNLVKLSMDANKAVILTGCVPTADSALVKSLEGVSMLGVTQIDRIVEVVEEALKGNTVRILGQRRSLPSLELPKVRRNKFVEIIPISGGCLGNCSYCKTKHARGKLLSYPEADILSRAMRAVEEGCTEVWLTSEDTGAYGLDIGTNIANLLYKVSDALPAPAMLKLGMTNPPYMLAHIEAVADVLNRPNVFAFMHIPVQSGSDTVLSGMIREYTSDDFRRLVDGLRAKVPELLIATDIICGFPTEHEEDHKESLALVRDYKFPVLNISQFYPRPGTAAAKMKKLPSNDVKRRSGEMTELFNSYTTFDHLPGRTERVWFSDKDVKWNQTVGHTKGYAKVVVPLDESLMGRSAMVHLEKATKWHVEGKVMRRL